MSCRIQNLLKNVLKNGIISQQLRFYPRRSHRRPENIFEKYGGAKTTWHKKKNEENDAQYKSKSKEAAKPLIATNQKSNVVPTTDMLSSVLETIIDADGNFIYTKMKDNDVRAGTLLTEVKSKKEKIKKNLMLLEGKRLIKDALESGCQLKYILFSRMGEIEYLKPFLPKIGAKLYKMPYEQMQMWSDLLTAPGVMGIFKIPDVENFTPREPLPLTIICDNIREPGNLGTILSICAAVRCETVLLTKGCVNLWDSKVLRSSMGAHFKLNIQKGLDWEKIEEIPFEDAKLFIADNKLVSDSDQDPKQEIPLVPYYGVNFNSSKRVFLIVGGETLGVSKDSYELATKRKGVRLNIPLSNGMDSLNVGAALGVIAFEIRKQFTLLNK